MAKVIYEMEKQKTASHYEHIEGMSEEFSHVEPADLGEIEGGDDDFRHWQLRIQLAIAQQLSVISQTLKELKDKQ